MYAVAGVTGDEHLFQSVITAVSEAEAIGKYVLDQISYGQKLPVKIIVAYCGPSTVATNNTRDIVICLLRKGRMIEAVKKTRELTGWDLYVSKIYVGKIQDEENIVL